MTTISLDAICRNWLVKRGYPIHYYIQSLVYAKDCLRELHFDDLKCINTKIVAIDPDLGSGELPNDFQDYVQVAIKVGQNLHPLVETDKINPLVNRDSNFNPIPYNQQTVDPNNLVWYGYLYPFYWHSVTWNEWGEFTGRMFGFGAGVQDDVFSIFPERNQIQLTENLGVSEIVLEYISDGMNSDAATKITPYAYQTISEYIMWQYKENSRIYSEGERERAKQEYISQRMILRARLSDINAETLTRALQRGTYASPKSR